eukprot:811925-Prorocentrum_minimum.AAC.2
MQTAQKLRRGVEACVVAAEGDGVSPGVASVEAIFGRIRVHELRVHLHAPLSTVPEDCASRFHLPPIAQFAASLAPTSGYWSYWQLGNLHGFEPTGAVAVWCRAGYRACSSD